jgi:hypothetical protein
MIKIQGQFTLEDFKNAQRLHMQARQGALSGFPAIFVVMAAMMVILTAVSLVVTGQVDWIALFFPFTLLVTLGVQILVMQPRQMARIYQQQKDLSTPLEIEISDEAYAVAHQYGTSRIPWQDFVKWKEDSQMILLYRSDLMMSYLPKRFLAGEDQVQYVRDQLLRNNVPAAYKIPRRNRVWRAVVVALLVFIAACVILYINLRQAP